MFLDSLGQVSLAQEVTATAYSTNTVDLGNVTPKQQIGDGESVGFAVVCTAQGTDSGTCQIASIQSANANLSSEDILEQTMALSSASRVAGKVIWVDIPPGYPTKRYVGLKFTVASTVDFTVTAYLMPKRLFAMLAQTYAIGYTE